jgi:hypothetical protein
VCPFCQDASRPPGGQFFDFVPGLDSRNAAITALWLPVGFIYLVDTQIYYILASAMLA